MRKIVQNPLLVLSLFWLSRCFSRRVEYESPWKMTVASSDPVASRDFVMSYLGASHLAVYSPTIYHSNSKAPCLSLEWLAISNHTLHVNEAPTATQEFPFNQFQLHFVKFDSLYRATGDVSIQDFEETVAEIHGNFKLYDVFMDNRIVFFTSNLDPYVMRLARNNIKYFVQLNDEDLDLSDMNKSDRNKSGKFSMFFQIPHGSFVEIVSDKLTIVVKDSLFRLNRCGHADADGQLNIPTPIIDMSVIRKIQSKSYWNYLPTLTEIRFVWASTKPRESAELFIKLFDTKLVHRTEQNEFNGLQSSQSCQTKSTCHTSYTIQWSSPRSVDGEIVNTFEFQWIHWIPDPKRRDYMYLIDMEQYRNSLHGNFSTRSSNKWNHYMDYHPGLHIADCGPAIERLNAAAVDYFISRHLFIFAIYFKDDAGITYELSCPAISMIQYDDPMQSLIYKDISVVEDWDWCLERPAVATLHGELQ